ncbi:protein kinase domain-containing protein [Cryptosporidium andersoni]|uniref:Protein kinase domain-containing protein n=1 Tax=Cryptosporidium andersoni TaxID=117008 RepID=A0A1J4MSP5_9CRYT|nr:protein kinase domain-containing protein [Cryptosporidium andersoni]
MSQNSKYSFSHQHSGDLVLSPQTMVENLLLSQKDEHKQQKSSLDLVESEATSLVPYKEVTGQLRIHGSSHTNKDLCTKSSKYAMVSQYFNVHCPMCGRLMPQKFYSGFCPNLGSPLTTAIDSESNTIYSNISTKADERVESSDKISNRNSLPNSDMNHRDNMFSIESQNYFFFLEELFKQVTLHRNVKYIKKSFTECNDNNSNLDTDLNITNSKFTNPYFKVQEVEYSNTQDSFGEPQAMHFFTSNLPEYPNSKFSETPNFNLVNLKSDLLMTGYYGKFFKEIKKLGSGSFGQVYLCSHVLDDITLAWYAVKKVPVGDDRKWLSSVLREVKIRELLHHPNIVQYRHSWLEMYSSNDYCPKVPWLFQLMEYCNSGSLEDFILKMLTNKGYNSQKRMKQSSSISNDDLSRVEYSQELCSSQLAVKSNIQENSLSCSGQTHIKDDHIWKIFFDVILGLQHLHHRGILHRDLKPSNILLHIVYDEFLAQPICQALLSDFGTAQVLQRRYLYSRSETMNDDIHDTNRGTPCFSDDVFFVVEHMQRHGYTGTVEYTAPELLIQDENGLFCGEYDIFSDIWSLGITLYVLCYNRVPFQVDTFSGGDPEDPQQCRKAVLNGMHNLDFPEYPLRSSDLKLLIKALLDPEPEKRPNTDDILRHPRIQSKLRCSDLLVNASIELAKMIQNKGVSTWVE